MRVPIPHTLGKDEARRRLKARSGDLGSMMPGGMADVTVNWPDDDRMNLLVKAMGSSVNAAVEVGESACTVVIDLPMALKFFEPLIRSAVEKNGQKLLK